MVYLYEWKQPSQISGQKTTTSSDCFVIQHGDVWVSVYFLCPSQNSCHPARGHVQSQTVSEHMRSVTDHRQKDWSTCWIRGWQRCPDCLEGDEKEILMTLLLIARGLTAGTTLPEWHWWVSLRFHCRNTPGENYLVRAKELLGWSPSLCATTGENYKTLLKPARLSSSKLLKSGKRPPSHFLSPWFMRSPL